MTNKKLNRTFLFISDKNRNVLEDCDALISELNKFNTKWNNYLANTKIDENLLKNASETIDNLKRKAKIEKEANAGKILDNMGCLFNKNAEKISSGLIGDLSLIKTSGSIDNLDFGKLLKYMKLQK